ncbi:MAG: acyl carrier protein [Ruminococcaceae bacterium]|nr:acyl carrier protein [Oscillospiraceae bacterium]
MQKINKSAEEEKMLDKMREIICEFVDMDPKSITLETNIRKDLGLNSLELVNLAVDIEEEFDVEIPDKEAMGLETVADAIKVIEKYMD